MSVVECLLGPLRGEELSQQQSPSGDSLLHVACWEGKARLVTTPPAFTVGSNTAASGTATFDSNTYCCCRELYCRCWYQPTRRISQPTHSLICQCHCLQVTMLLARGHDVHSLSRNRSTPLHYAAWNGHLETVNDSE